MALTEVYVDPSRNGDVGAGTIGDPFGDLEYAIEQTTFDTTNGTRVNIKAGTAEVLAAPLETAMADTGTSVAWAPTNGKYAIFQGYTSTAGDGGVATIDCTTSGRLVQDDGIGLFDLAITNTAGAVIQVANYLLMARCSVEGNATGRTVYFTAGRGLIQDCYFYGQTHNSAVIYGTGMAISNCYIENGTGNYAIQFNVDGMAINNIITVSAAGGYGIFGNYGTRIANNSIYHTAGNGTKYGITSTNLSGAIDGNLVEGFAGSGGVGIQLTGTNPMVHMGGNAVYNCETAYSTGTINLLTGSDNETLSASPFTDAANGDFSPVDTGNVKEGSLPNIVGGGLV